jgi:hypothetical protein
MSSRNNARIAPKPFCKVCQDAGKSESEYTSHFVKSEPGPNGKIVCPTLLSLECRYCFNPGHTAGYCPVLEEKEKDKKRTEKQQKASEYAEKRAAAAPAATKGKGLKVTNVFAAFDDSSDDEKPAKVSNNSKKQVESNQKQVVSTQKQVVVESTQKQVTFTKEEFPSLCAPARKSIVVNMPSVSYAGMATKTVAQYETEQYEKNLKERSAARNMPPVFARAQTVQQHVFADEDEDEEEVQHYSPPMPYKGLLASQMDWTATYDSDDEEW